MPERTTQHDTTMNLSDIPSDVIDVVQSLVDADADWALLRQD